MGRARLELRANLRSFPAHGYVIFYEVAGGTVRIISVLHAGLFGSGHKRSVKAGSAAEGPAGRLAC